MSTIQDNVTANKAAQDALQLVIDYGVELGLSPDATSHYWACVFQQVKEIVGPQRATPSSTAKITAESKSLARKRWMHV